MLTDSVQLVEALQIYSEVSNVLKHGNFDLRKFYSNNNESMKYVNESILVDFNEQENVKTLGITWISKQAFI